MKTWVKACWLGTRFCGDCLLWLVCWSLWLALGALMAVQIYIATSHELAVPGFVLRAMESRFAASHFQTTFGRVVFDPSGRILVEDTYFYLPLSPEPVFHARTITTQLNLWSMVAGKFEPKKVQIEGLTMFVPAALSASGRHEPLINDLQAIFRENKNRIELESLSAHVGSLAIHVSGAISLESSVGPREDRLPVADYLAVAFPDLCKQLTQLVTHMAAFNEPSVDIHLTPSATQAAIAEVEFGARTLQLAHPIPIESEELNARFSVPITGNIAREISVTVTAAHVKYAELATAGIFSAEARGLYTPSKPAFQPVSLDLSAASVQTADTRLDHVTTRITPGPLPALTFDLTTLLEGEPVAISGALDTREKSGTVRVDADISPGLLDVAGRRLKQDLHEFIDFNDPPRVLVSAAFKPGWKFDHGSMHLWTGGMDIKGSAVDYVRGEIEFDGNHLVAHDVVMKKGTNRATGIYEMRMDDRYFRFLLRGNLRPLEISDWFQEWWPEFFSRFDFSAALPEASVDVLGWWGRPRETTVFVYMDALSPIIEGVQFDHARTILFIRPFFYEGLEVLLTQGAGRAQGTFTRLIHLDRGLRYMDFDFDSTLDLEQAAQIFGTGGLEMVAPFHFEKPPAATLKGRIYGPASAQGESYSAHITAESTGGFSLYDFPLSNLSVVADVDDGNVSVQTMRAGFAGGFVVGNGRLWREDDEKQHLGYDLTIKGASLAQAVTTFERYMAQRKKLPATPPGKFVGRSPNVRFDLAASAEGLVDDPLSFQGSGNTEFSGPELGEVKLLGVLSNLLSFTSLRFTSARASFKIDRSNLVFPEVNVTGSNSAIIARGNYSIATKQLDFNARVYPFRESKTIVQNLFNTVLTPLSAVLEVKLSNTLEDPEWVFAMGPSNFLRNLRSEKPSEVPQPAAPESKKQAPFYLRR